MFEGLEAQENLSYTNLGAPRPKWPTMELPVTEERWWMFKVVGAPCGSTPRGPQKSGSSSAEVNPVQSSSYYTYPKLLYK